MVRRALVPVAVAAATLVAGAAACALDFDRFDPGDAAANPSVDGSNESNPGDTPADATTPADAFTADDAAAPEDVSTAEGGDDASAILDGPADGPCAPSSSCLASARTCSTACAQQEQQCRAMCSSGTCRSNCTRTETACLGQCETTCSSCTQSAGCSASAACADASR
jgi:hypothetical protein